MSRCAVYTVKVVLFCALVTAVILSFSLYGFFSSRKSETALPASGEIPLSSIQLVLDAGHGGEDGGASANGVQEKDINLIMTQAFASYLKMTPYSVRLTRTDDRLLYEAGEENRKKYYDLVNRVRFAQQFDHAVFISIHQNKFEIPKYKGLQVYYSPNHELSEPLAKRIQDNARQLLAPDNNRQIKKADHRIRVLNSLQMPAVLVECGFLSNPEEAALLSESEYQKKIAFVLFLSTLQFLEENGENLS